MTKDHALKYLAQGHDLWEVKKAKEICKAFDLELPEGLILCWRNQQEANPTNDPKGLWLYEPDKPGEGVGSIELSNFVVRKLGVEVRGFYGRGSQARENARAIREMFGLKVAA